MQNKTKNEKKSKLMAKIHYTSFPVASPQDTANYLYYVKIVCRVANKCATSWQLWTSPSLRKLRGNVSNGFWAYKNINTHIHSHFVLFAATF